MDLKLPCNPDIVCADPLSVCDEPFPPAWDVIRATIDQYRRNQLNQLRYLPNIIQDLAYSLHGNSKADAGFLRSVILATYPDPKDPAATTILDNIFVSASSLPTLFPANSIPVLTQHQPMITLSRSQITSLVVHQLLGTLTPPVGNTWGCNLLCWFSSHQPLRKAVHGYIATLFHYLKSRPFPNRQIQYELVSLPTLTAEEIPVWLSSDRRVFDLLDTEPTEPSKVKFPPSEKCVLVSSHSSPGFGSACTQEELITAACPDLLPLGALFVSPPVPVNAALIAQGVLPVSTWEGERRDAHLVDLLTPIEEYTFLFLDAAELDMMQTSSDSLVDLEPQLFLRDLHKCYVGFTALRQRDIATIVAPLWGAGAFGADPVIKTLILAMASTLAQLKVTLLIDQTRVCKATGGENTENLLDLVRGVMVHCANLTVQELWSLLTEETYPDGLSVARKLVSRV